MKIISKKLPFDEKKISSNTFIRRFSPHDSEEFEWHQDAEDRVIEVIGGSDWKLQLDNQIPLDLKKGQQYFVPKEKLHRIIAGPDTLVVKLTKIND